MQGVLTETDNVVSQHMVRWAEGLNRETIVRAEGVIQEPPKEEGQEEVKSASVHAVEVRVEKACRDNESFEWLRRADDASDVAARHYEADVQPAVPSERHFAPA